MAAKSLPSLRALQTFEIFGRTMSVSETAREMNITPGAVSQQLKVLEEQTGQSLFSRRGRGLFLREEASSYHKLISEAFELLHLAQNHLDSFGKHTQISISAFPSLSSKWLYPLLNDFHDGYPDIPVHIQSNVREPDRHLATTTFRITLGNHARAYPHQAQLFTDAVFPICTPTFLEKYPDAGNPEVLSTLPLIYTDWGSHNVDLPSWADWFTYVNAPRPKGNSSWVFSLFSLALEAALEDKGVILGHASVIGKELEKGRLIRLSEDLLVFPKPYYVCWGEGTLQNPSVKNFLDWLLAEGKRWNKLFAGPKAQL
ncbi:LysR substrate-binding domain-containing protein [Leisingera thetidis]|uniref:LysR substrate-binding domain-containing protein n=1 Tax=Leisingera thetidis TaxID=2930199 RepID=UPI0021F6F6FA|nr:LysR substrate-binding domain-containing protein [Leisingera thetidis]